MIYVFRFSIISSFLCFSPSVSLTHSLAHSLTHSFTRSLDLSICLSVCLSIDLSISLLARSENQSGHARSAFARKASRRDSILFFFRDIYRPLAQRRRLGVRTMDGPTPEILRRVANKFCTGCPLVKYTLRRIEPSWQTVDDYALSIDAGFISVRLEMKRTVSSDRVA